MKYEFDDWDNYFFRIASTVSSKSKDPSTKVGAVIVHPDTKRIISTGYNGFPRGISDDDRLLDREKKYTLIIHAEVNAIVFAQCDLQGMSIYCTQLPCSACAKVIIQSGIRRVYAPDGVSNDFLERWDASFRDSISLFKESGVSVYWEHAERYNPT